MERVAGIEPATNAWEAFILPLNYTRKAIIHLSQWPAEGMIEENFLFVNEIHDSID